jgi:hypothetical protein
MCCSEGILNKIVFVTKNRYSDKMSKKKMLVVKNVDGQNIEWNKRSTEKTSNSKCQTLNGK